MEAVAKTPEREAFYRKIDGENLSALWNVMGDLITPEPRSGCRPHLWKYDAIRAYMMEARERRRSSTTPTATPARRWSRRGKARNGTPATG